MLPLNSALFFGKNTMTKNFERPELFQFKQCDYTIHQRETKYDGFFNVDEIHLSHKLYQGSESEVISREIFVRGDAVVLLPYDPVKDLIVFNEQFRAGAMNSSIVKNGDSPWLLEFVAGMFGENESPIEVAIREAKEEANLTIEEKDIQKVMKYFSSPGGTSEVIHLYVAKVDSDKAGGIYGLPEEGEDILTHVISRIDAMELLAHGKISNAATIIGLQWLQMNYQQLQKN